MAEKLRIRTDASKRGKRATDPRSEKAKKAPRAEKRRLPKSDRAVSSLPEAGTDLKSGTPRPASSEGENSDCIVVGIGASAGGLDAFKRFLNAMPNDSGMAFVLIQHLDPSRESLMANLLSKYTTMPVVQVASRTTIAPNCVYMIPPNKYISMRDNELFLEEAIKTRGMRMPIDHFFRSLAEARAERAVCVVLSGTGADGTAGLKDVKAAGGIALAQAVASAEYDGMPRSAVGSGLVDFELTIEEIPDVIVKYAAHPYALLREEDKALLCDDAPDHFTSILNLLKIHTDYDFRCYKKGTLNRRIERRMGLNQVKQLGDYLRMLREDPAEVDALFKDLLIGVTRFYREREAWEVLNEAVVHRIVSEKAFDRPVRVWVPGCATGEEVYSIAILFYEQMAAQRKNLEIQIFGTDLDQRAIAQARSGLYSAGVAGDISPERLNQFLQEEGDRFRVVKRLRESTVFAVQNIISDPPFSNLDMVSCRNLLIYLEPDIQKRLMQLFHFALAPSGYLFLGASESVTKESGLFKAVSSTWRIYKKVGRRDTGKTAFPVVPPKNIHQARPEPTRDASRGSTFLNGAERAKKALLERFAPPSVLVDHRYEAVYFHGSLEPYLSVPPGEPTHNLLSIAKEGLRSKLRGLIRQAAQEGHAVTGVSPHVKRHGDSVAVQVTVEPIEVPEDTPLFLVSFSDEPAVTAKERRAAAREAAEKKGEGRTAESDLLIDQLEYELQATREDLQSTIEELETANEELKASNEEVLSMNEELQSTNEELETSREELQSLNEELSTVNSQLAEKVSELESTNNDLSNLLAGTDIATLFLDTDFRIRRFTPACTALLHILPTDTGRPINDLMPRVNDSELLDDARRVLETLAPVEKEVHNGDGRAFMRRILPYRTSENRIEGVVVTFTDVSLLLAARRQVEVRERQQAAVARLGQLALGSPETAPLFKEAMVVIRETLDVDFVKIVQRRPETGDLLLVAGEGWDPRIIGNATVGNGVDSQAGYTLQGNAPVAVPDLSVEKRFRPSPLATDYGISSGISTLIGGRPEPFGVLGAHCRKTRHFGADDVNFLQAVAHVLTEAIARLEVEMEIRARERRIRLLTDAMPVLVSYCDRDRVYRFCNARYTEWFGLTPEQVLGKPIAEVVGEEAYLKIDEKIERVLLGERISFEDALAYRHGPPRDVQVDYIPDVAEDGAVGGFYVMVQDISDRVSASQDRARLAAIVEYSNDAILGKDLDGNITSWNRAAEQMFGYRADEIVGRNINLLVPAERLAEQREILDGIRRGEAAEQVETVRKRKDGDSVEVLVTVSPILDCNGTIIGASSIAHDIGYRLEREREMHRWTDRLEERVAEHTAVAKKRAVDLREMAMQITNAEQRARKTLAHAIHDDLQQLLVAAKLRVPSGGAPHKEEALARVTELLDKSLQRCRSLVSELKPPILNNGSLGEAFEWLARHMLENHDLNVRLDCTDPTYGLDEDTKLVVFEAVRELLFNVVKHAGTDQAELGMNRDGDRLTVTVADEGKGFTPVLDGGADQTSGYGLLSARERIEAFGGAIHIDSAPGQGARFILFVPISSGKTSVRSRRSAPDGSTHGAADGSTEDADVEILVVDDHEVFREGLARILSEEPGFNVVGQASDGGEAIEKALALVPDVVVMDISMPGVNGIEATSELLKRLDRTRIIGLSLHNTEDLGQAMLDAGAVDYLQKDCASTTIIEAIRKYGRDR